jgi:hypothetical protein
MPARIAVAAFSPKPHAGKLNALMKTAAPLRERKTCWPTSRGLRPSWAGSPSVRIRRSPSDSPSDA